MIILQELVWPASWEEASIVARHLTDRLGCPIDDGILEMVVALNLLGLRTCQSCEGHLEEGHPYPWVNLETDEFPAFKQALEDASREELSSEEQEAKGAHLVAIVEKLPSRGVVYTRLEALLHDYHLQRHSSLECPPIALHWFSPIFFRILPSCAYGADEWPVHERASNLAHAQAEMRAFTAFLKQRFFESEQREPVGAMETALV